jgi:membrane protein
MAFMLAFMQVPISWAEILRRTFTEAFSKDNCLGMAAQLAYYFLFALFPTLLVMIAFADIFAADVMQMISGLGGFIPNEGLTIVTEQLGRLTEGEEGGLLTIGMLTALWSSSAAMTAIIDTLNAAYDIEEGRPWWKVRITAMVLTIGLSVFIVVAFALVVAGPTVAERLADRFFLGAAFEWTWKILQWPLVFAMVSGGLAVVYYFAPDAEQDWVWLTPGSIFATVLWLLASLGFKYYIATFGGGYASYGLIGGVMVLMLWFYISGLVILIGAEMNAVIEHASAYGKADGEKFPGQFANGRRRIGPSLKRAWEASMKRLPSPKPGRTHTPAPPLPQPAPVVRAATPAVPEKRAGGGWTDWAIGAPVVVMQALWTLRSYKRRINS